MATTDTAILEAAKAALLVVMANPAASYSINGRSFSSHNISELRKLIADYEARVARSTRGAFELGGFACQ